MPSTLSYPGVYIEEIPSGVRTIVGVPTSVAAFVGRAVRGPVDEPVVVNNYGDFATTFGGLWEGSTLGYAVSHFFGNGGGQAVVVRVSQDAIARRFTVAIGSQQVQLEASSPGAWGKTLSASAQPVSISATQLTALKTALGLDPADELYNLTLEYRDPRDATRILASETFRNVVAGKPAHPADITNVLKDRSNLARVAAAGAAPVDLGVDTGPIKTRSEELAAALAADDLKLPASGAIDWGKISTALGAVETKLNDLKGALDTASTAFGQSLTDQLTVLESDQALKNLIVAVKAPPITSGELDQVGNQIVTENAAQSTALVKARSALPAQTAAQAAAASAQSAAAIVLDAKTRTADNSQTEASKKSARLAAIDAADTALAKATRLVPDADREGDDGNALTLASFVGGAGDSFDADGRGLYALKKADIFNLLCIPPYTATGDVEPTLISAAIALCKERRAFLIIDPPSTWTSVARAKAGLDTDIGDAHPYGAVFFPRLRLPDPLRNNQMADFAPCGAVAGVMARTDTQRGVWKAPAGLEATLIGVPQLSLALTDEQNGELNPLGINCLRAFPAAGRVVWGARTRFGDDRLASEWKYIPIRRLANYIEESLFRGTQWVVFEPNDEPLWSQIRLNVGAFMQDLFRQGAFMGRTPREAFFVKCDRETNPQSDVNKGIVNIIVGFAPLKPAEFVVIKLQQMAGELGV